jgi:hypothetical protein
MYVLQVILQISFNESGARIAYESLPPQRRLTPFASIVPVDNQHPFAALIVHAKSEEGYVRSCCIGEGLDSNANKGASLQRLYRAVVTGFWGTNNALFASDAESATALAQEKEGEEEKEGGEKKEGEDEKEGEELEE